MKKIIGKITELRQKINRYFQNINNESKMFNYKYDSKYTNSKKNLIKNHNLQNYNQYFNNLTKIYENIIKYRKFNFKQKYYKLDGRNLIGFIEYAKELLEFKNKLKSLYDKYYNIKNKINKKLEINTANVNTNNEEQWNFDT
jgi:hypothetical protein